MKTVRGVFSCFASNSNIFDEQKSISIDDRVTTEQSVGRSHLNTSDVIAVFRVRSILLTTSTELLVRADQRWCVAVKSQPRVRDQSLRAGCRIRYTRADIIVISRLVLILCDIY